MSKIKILIYTLEKYNLQTRIVSFPDQENLLKEVVVKLTLFMNSNRAFSRKLGQRLILAKKGTLFEEKTKKVTTNFITLYSNQFLSVLDENKALYNFQKMGQGLKAGCCFCLRLGSGQY